MPAIFIPFRFAILLLLFIFLTKNVKAEQMYFFVNIDCDKEKQSLSVRYERKWNEEGERLAAEHTKNRWNTWDLASISVDENGKYIINKKQISTTCELGSIKYIIDIEPIVGPGFSPEGRCATRMGARVEIKVAEHRVALAANDGCSEDKSVTKSITIYPGKEPIYEEVDGINFYY